MVNNVFTDRSIRPPLRCEECDREHKMILHKSYMRKYRERRRFLIKQDVVKLAIQRRAH